MLVSSSPNERLMELPSNRRSEEVDSGWETDEVETPESMVRSQILVSVTSPRFVEDSRSAEVTEGRGYQKSSPVRCFTSSF